MKRDLKKYLNQRCEELGREQTIENYCEILNSFLATKSDNKRFLEGVQALWMDAQKQFLKDILDDIDAEIEKLFRGKARVENDKAQAVAFEASIKEWLKGKYHYLKRKNKG